MNKLIVFIFSILLLTQNTRAAPPAAFGNDFCDIQVFDAKTKAEITVFRGYSGGEIDAEKHPNIFMSPPKNAQGQCAELNPTPSFHIGSGCLYSISTPSGRKELQVIYIGGCSS